MSFIHFFLILNKAIKYTWMAHSLWFCRWSIHQRHYSWSNRSFPHQSRGKQKRISDMMEWCNKLFICQISTWKWSRDTSNDFSILVFV
jgi:hypothetical protein